MVRGKRFPSCCRVTLSQTPPNLCNTGSGTCAIYLADCRLIRRARACRAAQPWHFAWRVKRFRAFANSPILNAPSQSGGVRSGVPQSCHHRNGNRSHTAFQPQWTKRDICGLQFCHSDIYFLALLSSVGRQCLVRARHPFLNPPFFRLHRCAMSPLSAPDFSTLSSRNRGLDTGAQAAATRSLTRPWDLKGTR